MGEGSISIERLLIKQDANGNFLARYDANGHPQIFCSHCERYVYLEDSEYKHKSPKRRCKQCASAYVRDLKKRLKSGEPKRYFKREEKNGLFQCCTCREYKIKVVEGKLPRSRCNECDAKRVRARQQKFKSFIESGGEAFCHLCGKVKSGSGDDGFVHGKRGCKKCSTVTQRMRTYGLTRPQAEEMTNRKVCDICGSKFNGIRGQHIDHCHSTNLVRGVLCNLCNAGIGYFKDDVKRLESAIAYLQGQGEPHPKSSYGGGLKGTSDD